MPPLFYHAQSVSFFAIAISPEVCSSCSNCASVISIMKYGTLHMFAMLWQNLNKTETNNTLTNTKTQLHVKRAVHCVIYLPRSLCGSCLAVLYLIHPVYGKISHSYQKMPLQGA